MESVGEQSFFTVNQMDRLIRNGHKELLVWLTGLSASGKTTLSKALEWELFVNNIQVCRLDGDTLRQGINQGLGYTEEDRQENVRRIAQVSNLFLDTGFVVIVAAISPYREGRRYAQQLIGSSRFLEVYVKCSIQECEKRDPKGLYRKARALEIEHFTGITSPYEEPVAPSMILSTDSMPIDECVSLLKTRVQKCISLET